jgi:Putative zinc-finger
MSNDHIKSEISVYLAGGLTEVRNRQIEAHVASCEKCEHAIAKARTKQARVKREALKKASPDPLPNLFLARQGKEMGIDRFSSKKPWVVTSVLVLLGLGYWAYRHYGVVSPSLETPVMTQEPSAVAVSTAPVISSATLPAPPPTPAEGEARPSGRPVAPAPVVPPPEKPKPTPRVLKVFQEWKGADSGIQNARVVVIRSKEAWGNLWAEMQDKETLPEVNFDREIVLCIFAGARPPGVSVSLGRIHEGDEQVVVPYRVSGPEIQVSSTTVIVPAHPYLLATMSRVEKKIRMTQREVSE